VRATGAGRTLTAGAVIVLICIASVARAAGAGGTRLTLRAGRSYIAFGQVAALTGSGTSQGRRLADVRIVLQADEFPFSRGFHSVAVERTTADGRYRFAVRPSRATRYRVLIGRHPASGAATTVYVVARDLASCNLCGPRDAAGVHTFIVRNVYQFPPGPIAIPGTEYFYYGQTDGSNSPPATIRLVMTVPLRSDAPDELRATVQYTVHFPAGRFEFRYVTCHKDAEARDGLGLPGNHHCGDPTLTRAVYSGYVG
jgi:hypothetical protein